MSPRTATRCTASPVRACVVALLADRPDAGVGGETVTAVAVWTGSDPAGLHQLDRPAPARVVHGIQLTLPLAGPAAAGWLELGTLGTASPSSCGRTWRTWLLASIPPRLRDQPPDQLAVAVARTLAG